MAPKIFDKHPNTQLFLYVSTKNISHTNSLHPNV